VRDARHAVDMGLASLEARDVVHLEGSKVRVRDRNVLRYYARTIQHLVPSAH